MGAIRQTEPVKLFCGVIASDVVTIEGAIAELQSLAGPPDYCSLPIPFTFTDYYAAEMGSHLQRVFVSFERRIDPGDLARLKVGTNRIEARFAASSEGGGEIRRRVNLDPGFLTLHSVVLASTKNFQHRIPVGGGIYLEQEMLFTKNDVRFLPWTYPDFRSQAYIDIFRQMRRLAR